MLSWKWKDGSPPADPVGHGVGEYSRSKLAPEQERMFVGEVMKWIDAGWLVPDNDALHDSPAAVLPLLAQMQDHKASTPVRPCLDHRSLNALLLSQPGREALVCEETLRKWRREGDPEGLRFLDIKKAYLQVHLASELQRHQTVVWQEKAYVMTRMGFRLGVAPKFMDIIVRLVTRDFPSVDNYVDNVITPANEVDAVAARMLEYGLPTKQAEPLPHPESSACRCRRMRTIRSRGRAVATST